MERVTPQRAAELFELCSNWGRWGAGDERGALNLITPAMIADIAGRVVGRTVSCSRELPVTPEPGNPLPAHHHMVFAGDVAGTISSSGLEATADSITVACHGFATSHIDALCHVFHEGRMYNGYPGSEVLSTGARRNSVLAGRDGIVGRGVLLDIPRLRGVDWLEPDEVVTPDDLDGAAVAAGLTIQAGDIVLVGTGRDARRAAHGPWDGSRALAGLDPECAMWLRQHDVAVLGSDGVSDPRPGNTNGWPMPIHVLALVAMGVHLLDNLRLDRLAAACASEGRWEFLLTVAPLVIEGGTGSAVNPIAVL